MKHPHNITVMLLGDSTTDRAYQDLYLSGVAGQRVITRGFYSHAQAWNRAILQCPTDQIILASEAAVITRRCVEVILGCLKNNFGMVMAGGADAIALHKDLVRKIGPFDESAGLADMIIRMWEQNIGIAELHLCKSRERATRVPGGVWGRAGEKRRTFEKWALWQDDCGRLLGDPMYNYDFGVDTSQLFLPWGAGELKNNLQFFNSVLPCEQLPVQSKEMLVRKSHREFIEK